MKKYIIFFYVYLFITQLWAAESQAYWLQIIPDARALAMGGSQVAIATGQNASYWNPARMYNANSVAISVANMHGLYNHTSGSMSYSFPVGTIGFSGTTMLISDIPNTDYINGRPSLVQNFDCRYLVGVLTYANKIDHLLPYMDNFFWGVNVKYYNNKLFDTTGTGLGIDLGIQYSFTKTLCLGATVYNFPQVSVDWSNGTKEIYPQRTRFGLGWEIFTGLLLSADLEQDSNNRVNSYSGLEYWLNPILALRGGSNTDAFSAGIGLNLNSFILDIAYYMPINTTTGLNPYCRFSVSTDW